MENPLIVSLIVSGVGMVLLFIALGILYGLMYLMTAVIKDRPADVFTGEAIDEGTADTADEAKRIAAVIGVALARAERETFAPSAPPEEASPWWTLHLQRQLTNRIPMRSAR